MSHVAEVDVHIKDLESLRAACAALGLEFREGQTTYRWFGEYIGDAPLPQGFTISELGTCEHAIGVPGSKDAYEIGVLRRRDGKPGFALFYDSWEGGYGLERIAGLDACLLRQEYSAQVAAKGLRTQGYRVRRVLGADGRIRLVGTQ